MNVTTNNQAHTQTSLAGEIAKIVFGERIVPASAWTTIDRIVDEGFTEWSGKRIEALIADVAKMRACFEDCDPADLDGPSGLSTDLDWATFSCAVRDCQEQLGFPRQVTDEPSDADSVLDDWCDDEIDRDNEDNWYIEELSDAR